MMKPKTPLTFVSKKKISKIDELKKQCLQRRRVSNDGPQIAMHTTLGREIDLLKEFRRDGQAAGRLDLADGVFATLLRL